MKNKTINIATKFSFFLLLLLYIITVILFFVPQKASEKISLLYFIIIILFILTGILFVCMYVKLSKFSHDIEKTIDTIIKGNKILPQMEEETLFSQIYHQLYVLMNILNSTNDKLVDDRQNLQLLISDISHQVKTPLTNLVLLLSSFQRYDLSNEEKNSFINMMNNQLDKITILLESMIKTSCLETGIIKISPSICSISNTLLKAIEGIFPAMEKKNIKLDYTYLDEITCLHDSKWCIEAFINILDNAVKYTPNDGTITIKTSTLHYYAQITFSDTGIGISSNEYAKIFQRFYRSPSVHNEAGVGLGLYLARHIITEQNGYITVSSQLGKGTTFTILLPIG